MRLAGLEEHQLLRPLDERDKKRWLFVTSDLERLLSGHGDASFPSALADGAIGTFCKGWIAKVSREQGAKAVDFKKLKNHDEAWVMFLPGPGPGWRLFGRFARKNMFVGLSCFPRDECWPFAVYQQRAQDMITDWQGRFAADPLRSNDYRDYFGDMVFDKDEA